VVAGTGAPTGLSMTALFLMNVGAGTCAAADASRLAIGSNDLRFMVQTYAKMS
jgi:hypothetical protein